MTCTTDTALYTATEADRWTTPIDPLNGEWTPDPGPYSVGESIECPRCGTSTTVTKSVVNERSAGTQYVAHTSPHAVP
ncbi:hypothetical protein GCM10010331_44220 [Streptomyces xanthochromogenes]|nr:hypothetical protein GCM10010331_44220 [Streptomyces xanthochromogenes]